MDDLTRVSVTRAFPEARVAVGTVWIWIHHVYTTERKCIRRREGRVNFKLSSINNLLHPLSPRHFVNAIWIMQEKTWKKQEICCTSLIEIGEIMRNINNVCWIKTVKMGIDLSQDTSLTTRFFPDLKVAVWEWNSCYPRKSFIRIVSSLSFSLLLKLNSEDTCPDTKCGHWSYVLEEKNWVLISWKCILANRLLYQKTIRKFVYANLIL